MWVVPTLESENGGVLAKEGFAVVTGDVLPAGHAVVSMVNEDLVLSRRAVPLRPLTHRAWLPVNTEPQLIRHGQTEMSFDISNPSHKPAMIRFTLFGERGDEIARRELLVPPGVQEDWSLGDLFNLQKAEGMVRVWSDVAIGIGGTVRTKTIRGEIVENHVPFLSEEQMAATGSATLPIIIDGEGIATQVQFINRHAQPVNATWRFQSPEGEPKEIVLR